MKKGEKTATKSNSGAQKTAVKTAQTSRIVTGSEIPNLLKKRPFKIRYF